DGMLARLAALRASGVTVVALLALSDDGAPSYDAAAAATLASLGMPAFACTPDAFPDLLAAAIEGRDVAAWAHSRNPRLGGFHGQSRARVASSGAAPKYFASTSPKTGASGAAAANSVIDERSFTASMPPKMSSAVSPPVPATMRAHSVSRGPSTWWLR